MNAASSIVAAGDSAALAPTSFVSGAEVDLDFLEGQRNYRLLFGHPVAIHSREHIFGITRRTAVFSPGARFGLELWEGGIVPGRSSLPVLRTLSWRVLVLEVGAPGERVERVPRVRPGAHVLTDAEGPRRCRLLLRTLAELEREEDLAALPREFFLGRELAMPAVRREQNAIVLLDGGGNADGR